MITDEHRGIDSGGSGRTELWSAAVNLWVTHPIFGVGFKGHPLMMPDGMLAHNAYLGMLADVGIVGFGSYMLITGVALYYILKRGESGLAEFPLRMAIIFFLHHLWNAGIAGLQLWQHLLHPLLIGGVRFLKNPREKDGSRELTAGDDDSARTRRARLGDGASAVGDQLRPGNERGTRTGQKEGRLGDLHRVANSPCRKTCAQLLLNFLALGKAGGIHRAGYKRVGPNFWTIIAGDDAAKRIDSTLGHGVGAKTWFRDQGLDRGNIDNAPGSPHVA